MFTNVPYRRGPPSDCPEMKMFLLGPWREILPFGQRQAKENKVKERTLGTRLQ